MTDHNDDLESVELETNESVSASDAQTITKSIKLTDAAVLAAHQYQKDNAAWQNQPLRVFLSGKGCDGFDYGVCFDQQDPQDHSFLQTGITIVCDPETFKFVAGSMVDFVDDERGRGFIVSNPRHKQFRGKFYKRKGWEERLRIH